MADSSQDKVSITQILNDYFTGLHTGNVETLRAVFHEDVFLKAPGLRRNREDWLQAVASRPVPEAEGETFRFKLLTLDIVNDQAMAKVECPLFDRFYIDFLGLLKENGRWLIVNKMYADQ